MSSHDSHDGAEEIPRNNPPRNNLIALYSALAVATLVMLKPAFDTYFDDMRQAAVADRLQTHSDLGALETHRREWQRALSGSRTPIEQAMARVGEGRTAVPEVRPRVTEPQNMDPLIGWLQLPQMEAPAAEGADDAHGDDDAAHDDAVHDDAVHDDAVHDDAVHDDAVHDDAALEVAPDAEAVAPGDDVVEGDEPSDDAVVEGADDGSGAEGAE